MLQPPEQGFAPSVNEHNGMLDIQADWVEASVLFESDTVSHSDVVDALIENNSYRRQDFANAWVDIIFVELERRFKLLGAGSALAREGSRIRRVRDWKECSAYSFCIALTMLPHYREKVETAKGGSYVEQGELFERLIVESLRALHWDVEPVGWSRTATNSIEERIGALALALGEPSNKEAIARWTAPSAKDGGLDIIAWKSFPDGWAGRPICLVQCASGANWIDKLHTPNIETWRKLIDFATAPLRALAMPFAPEADHFRRRANSDFVILLMDRHRILVPTRDGPATFPSKQLAKDLVKWTTKCSGAFPKDSD